MSGSGSGELIDFDLIEGQKENIQSLPGGRSAKKLAELYSPSPLQKLSTPTPSDTRNVNDTIRAEFEEEVENIAESDDPLDVFERYVRWTLDAYPSAQATPQSQLHTLLERATKAFVGSAQYKNDPRYLKLWIHYIHFFSDTPRETYMFLSRHGIGESLALFYEEYATWLEGAGRLAQAEEVYKLGIERDARPAQRLIRKFKEFEDRVAQQPDAMNEPSSPALPTMRPALASKIDPFAAARAADPQAARPTSGGTGKSGKSKLAIFSDTEAQPSAMSSMGAGTKGWDSIGSLADRKKENEVEAKPWAGETLQAGGKKNTAPKMAIFRDKNVVVVPSKHQISLHPQTGKKERVFVDLAAIYPTPEEIGTELSFEEIMAANRGWLDHCWEEETFDESLIPEPGVPLEIEEISKGVGKKLMIHQDHVNKLSIHQDPVDKLMIRPDPVGKLAIHKDPVQKLVIHQDSSTKMAIHKDIVQYDENGRAIEQPRGSRGGKKKKIIDMNETQIIKAKLDSPSRPKLKKKNTSEPTMTLHTKAATDDIYDIFNAPLKSADQEEEESADEDDYESDDNYTTDAESTGTTRQMEPSDPGAEEEDEDEDEDDGDNDETSDAKSLSEWSDFSTRKHIPNIDGGEEGDEHDTQLSDSINDTAVQGPDQDPSEAFYNTDQQSRTGEEQEDGEEEGVEELETPTSEEFPPQARTTFIPIPPEDYEPPTRPFRDPAEVANNRLPFMTPITERTEMSLDMTLERHEYKTPCKKDISMTIDEEDEEGSDLEPPSSPLREMANDSIPAPRMSAPLTSKSVGPLGKTIPVKPLPPKGPIIKDVQCNPVDESVRSEIISKMLPPLSSYSGFYDYQHKKYERGGEIRKFAKALAKASKAGDKTGPITSSVVIEFPDVQSTYTIKKELGAGAFAPVYLVENSAPEADENDENATPMGKGAFAVNHRNEIEALKMESPPTPWEFHMMRLAHTRLGPQHRASASLSYAHEMHLYQDEAFLFLPYHPHGTLLDVVNFFRAEPSAVMDEQLAMFFTIELLRTVEALHSKSILHGDLKADNCLLRLDALSDDESLTNQWRADGAGGWFSRGVVLIDFGRGIDMRAFIPEVEFIADWKTSAQDCAEMREGRPWTWQIDYHGLAGTIHTLLFGKYIETVRCDQGGLGKSGRRYKIRESLKRYWQTELWSDCFELLLNPGAAAATGSEDGGKMPVLRSMKNIRERMETWLEANCERGVGLKSVMSKLEATFSKNRK
ncbi:bub kinase [Fusarium heterosporum]|uniref:Bub kinase n=1 Tax=Fusarium heterosporum TaxID=42747 RepID=A0A8H5T6I1_FUSHE|nr:bub kinase [Fusarium heterosporum]